MARVPQGVPAATSRRGQPLTPMTPPSLDDIHRTPPSVHSKHLAEADRVFEQVSELIPQAQAFAAQATAAKAAQQALSSWLSTVPVLAVKKATNNERSRTLIERALQDADQKTRESSHFGAPQPEEVGLSLREVAMAEQARDRIAAVAPKLAVECEAKVLPCVTSMELLDAGILKAEVQQKLPPSLRGVDAGKQLNELMRLSTLGADIREMLPSERLETWRMLGATKDTTRQIEFAHKALSVTRSLARKGPSALRAELGASNVDRYEKEIGACYALLGEIENWKLMSEPVEVTIAREIRERLRYSFRLLCGTHADFMSPSQCEKMLYTDSGLALMARPYHLCDSYDRIATRFVLPDAMMEQVRKVRP
jgi:hypothetical protein